VILAEGESDQIAFSGFTEALAQPDTAVRLFGKPQVRGRRRVGVALALGPSADQAKENAVHVARSLHIDF